MNRLIYEIRWNDSIRGRHGRDCMEVGFTTTCTISAFHH
jgi:hypothetical protein